MLKSFIIGDGASASAARNSATASSYWAAANLAVPAW
jgi:hypothetical protein